MLKPKSVFADRYHIQRHVYTGMSEVYEAYDLESSRKVALKLLPTGLHDAPVVQEVFRRETRALRELKHPHIVELLNSGIEGTPGTPFLTLEWVDYDLAYLIGLRSFEGWDSFYDDIGRPVLDALAFSHSRQVVHRDVKLKNVLVGPDRVPKLADFGIAKLRTDLSAGVTLRDYISVPYSPPERDAGVYVYSRDVYSFAVLVLRCLQSGDLTSYEDVDRSLDDIDLPSEIHAVLARCLDRDSANRPHNAEVLFEKLERIQQQRQRAWEVRPSVFLSLTLKACDGLRSEWPSRSKPELESLVFTDLQTFGVEPFPEPNGPPQFRIFGGRCWYHAIVSADGAQLFIINAGPDDEYRLERQREFAARPSVDLRFGMVRDLRKAAADLLDFTAAVNRHVDQVEAERRAKADEALLGSWDRILKAKEAIERRRSAPIPFDGVENDGNRLRFHPTTTVDEALIGQPRMVSVADEVCVQGEIESVTPDEVILYVEAEYRPCPRRGTLVVDTAQSRTGLDRQRKALDAVRFDRSVRSDLRKLLTNPSEAAAPEIFEVPSFFSDIDESKQSAVQAALGADDFLLVEGPPGTGKTTFITELILQELRRNPSSRILLASQTHVALDNALEGVRRADPLIRLARVGRHKVSPSVADLIVENQMPAWREACLRVADEYLDERANEAGVSLDHLRAARTLNELSQIRARKAEIEERLAIIKGRIARVDAEETAGIVSVVGEAVASEVDELRGEEAEARAELKELRAQETPVVEALLVHDPDLRDVLGDESTDLDDWAAVYRPAGTTSALLDGLIELRADWDLRFGKGREFQAALIASSQVIAGTCVGIAGIRGIQEIDFDLCIIDEASKANATEALVPMTLARRWVLVGDEKQLPPFVEEELHDEAFQAEFEIRRDELELTLFAQLSRNLDEQSRRSLLVQHRMRPAIGSMISECFYGGTLANGEVSGSIEVPNVFPRPVTWFSTAKISDRDERRVNSTFANPAEGRFIGDLLRDINRKASGSSAKVRVAVMTGYAGQLAELRRRLSAAGALEWLEVECNTVDAFQGREAHIGIYSVTRCNSRGELGFLRDVRRINVALSRARFALAIVGDHVFARNAAGENPFRRVIDFIEDNPKSGVVEIVR